MAGLESQGIASHGPMPAGMLRIRQGNQERYVWPVHLPGWLAMGWRVAGAGAEGPSVGGAATEPPAPIAVAAGDLLEQDDAKPASPRGRRGRRRKDEASTETAWQAEPGITPDQGGARADSEGDPGDGESGSQGDPDAGPDADPSADAAVDQDPAPADQSPDSEDALTALPDDLFTDPLI